MRDRVGLRGGLTTQILQVAPSPTKKWRTEMTKKLPLCDWGKGNCISTTPRNRCDSKIACVHKSQPCKGTGEERMKKIICKILGHKKVHRFAFHAVSWYCEKCGYNYYYMPPNNIRGFPEDKREG